MDLAGKDIGDSLGTLKHDDPCVWGCGIRGDSAFPHAISPILIRRGIDEQHHLRLPECRAQFGVQLMSGTGSLSICVGRLIDPHVSSALLAEEPPQYIRNHAVAMF